MENFIDLFIDLNRIFISVVCLYYIFILIKNFKKSLVREEKIVDILESINSKIDSK